MDDVQEIRRANLELLLDEVIRDLGHERGAMAELSRRSGVDAPTLSQFRNRRTHANGAPRKLGDDSCRKLERGTGRPVGWMDVRHDVTRSEIEADHLAVFRQLTPEQQQLVHRMAQVCAEQATATAPPPAETQPPKRTNH